MITDTDKSATDKRFMLRALQLARRGLGSVTPNPMVGAVIVSPKGKIIGEGYHRSYGGPHAEVNAVASVNAADRHLLPESTIYVSLEPCSHFGKTPPCSRLLVETGFRRVVIGTGDVFEKVDGRGIDMLKKGGIEVVVGVLEEECRSLNARFFTAHTLKRPFITLKWAQSADGFMDRKRGDGDAAAQFSDIKGRTLVHRLRALHEAIAVGSGTALADKPRLDVRLWDGKDPVRVIFDRRGRIGDPTPEIHDILHRLYSDGVTSILVEGGPTVLGALIDAGLWDLARVEVSPVRLGNDATAVAPAPDKTPFDSRTIGGNTLYYYSNNPLVNTYFVENGL